MGKCLVLKNHFDDNKKKLSPISNLWNNNSYSFQDLWDA